MKQLQHFNFDGLDESGIAMHPDHGPCFHSEKFIRWAGWSNPAVARADHLRPGDEVRIVSSIKRGRGVTRREVLHLTKRGVRRILFKSSHPRAEEYADKVLDMLDELDRTGMVVDEQRITDEQLNAGRERLDEIQARRMAERMDYQHVKRALAQGGAESDGYALVQNTLYLRLFKMIAAQIRASRKQLTGDRRKDGAFTAASKTVAKNYLTADELTLLNNTVLILFAQISQHYPNGASVAQMVTAVNAACDLTVPKAIAA